MNGRARSNGKRTGRYSSKGSEKRKTKSRTEKTLSKKMQQIQVSPDAGAQGKEIGMEKPTPKHKRVIERDAANRRKARRKEKHQG